VQSPSCLTIPEQPPMQVMLPRRRSAARPRAMARRMLRPVFGWLGVGDGDGAPAGRGMMRPTVTTVSLSLTLLLLAASSVAACNQQ